MRPCLHREPPPPAVAARPSLGLAGGAAQPVAGKGVDSAYAKLPAAYALFPMLAIQRVSPSDNFDLVRKQKRKKKLKHLVTRSAHRELMLSKLMRPFELVVALLSPAFFLAGMGRWPKHARATPRRAEVAARLMERPAPA